MADNNDLLLRALECVATYLSIPFPRDSIAAGLEFEDNCLHPRALDLICPRLGMKYSIERLEFSACTNSIGPLLIFTKDDNILVIKNYDAKKQLFHVFDAEKNKDDTILKSDLQAIYAGYAIKFYIVPEVDEDIVKGAERTHWSWFMDVFSQSKTYFKYILLASLMINIFSFAVPIFIMNVYDRVIGTSSPLTLWALASGVAVIIIFDLIVSVMKTSMLGKAATVVDSKLAEKLFNRSLRIRMVNKPNSSGAYLQNRKAFLAIREFLTSTTLATTIDAPFIVLYLAAIAYIGGFLVLVPIIGIVVLLFFNTILELLQRKHTSEQGMLATQREALQLEAINNLETIKLINAEGYFTKRYINCSNIVTDARGAKIKNISTNISKVVSQLTTVSLMIFGAYMIMNFTLSVGALVACSIFTGRAMLVSHFGVIFNKIKGFTLSIKKLDTFMNADLEESDEKSYVLNHQIKGDIEFINVTLFYPNQTRPSIKDMSCTIKQGEIVGIIGKTGSGKSSVFKMLTSLYLPTEGMLKIADISLSELPPSSLRQYVHYVNNPSKLLYGTLRDNICYQCSDPTPSNIEKVIEMTLLSEFIQNHNKGLDLLIDENNVKLSSGQIQQIALARALLSDANVLLLDEPFSNIDGISAKAILKNIIDNLNGRTLILNTHRPMLLNFMNRIIALENGVIIDDGAKDDVLNKFIN